MGLVERFKEFIISVFRKKSEFYEVPKLYKKSHDGTVLVRTDGHRIVAGRVYGGKTKLWEHYLFTIDENKLVLQE